MLGVRAHCVTRTPTPTHSSTTRISRYNFHGQVGLGDMTNRGNARSDMGSALPFVNLGTGQTASSVKAGNFHTCAIVTAGLKCWGCAPVSRTLLVYIVTHRSVNRSLQLTPRSRASNLFRYNGRGQLGLGDAKNRGSGAHDMGDALPFVSLGTGQIALKLALGTFHTCALLTDGVKCWGCALL